MPQPPDGALHDPHCIYPTKPTLCIGCVLYELRRLAAGSPDPKKRRDSLNALLTIGRVAVEYAVAAMEPE